MTLKEIVQEFCRRQGLPLPSLVAASRDDQIVQLQGLLHEILDDLEERKVWTALQIEATWAALAAELQGTIVSLANGGFKAMLASSFFNRTTDQRIEGPVDPVTWQAVKTGLTSLTLPHFRLRGGNLYITPAPTLNDTLAFEYQSSWAVLSAGGVAKHYFTADDDTCRYPDKLLILGLRYIWKREKGFPYAEEFAAYETAVAGLAGTDGTPRAVSLDKPCPPAVPGVAVPDRGWSL